MSPDDPRHGTDAGASQHIRDGEQPCPPCAHADLLAARRRTKRKTMGYRYTMPLGEANYDKLAALKRKGATWEQLAEWVGTSQGIIWRLLDRGPEQIVYTRTYLRIQNLRPGRIITPIGITRRIRALCALGYSPQRIADEAGVHLDTIRDARANVRDFLAIRVREGVADAYDRLQLTPPEPNGERERAGITRVRNLAARNGWASPFAWDDIDDPAETPNLGAPVVRGPGRFDVRNAILEDAEWLADDDQTLSVVLTRLGTNAENFYAACRRGGRLDLYAKLSDREPGEMSRSVRTALEAAS